MKKEIITQSDPKSPISEVFRALRTNLQFMNRAVECQTILVTSTVQSEGKSWISANLATTFAQTGARTLIVDADMRKPRQHKIFQVNNVPGFSNYLSGINDVGRKQDVSVSDCIKQTNIENLYLLPSGNIPPNPSELLMTDKTIELLDEVTKEFDVVIFDGAPCLLVTDSTILSRIVDNTVIVTSYKYTKIDDLKEAVKRIKRVGGNIAGVILNRIQISNKKYESKYYYANTNVPSTNVRSSTKSKELKREKLDTKADKEKEIKKDVEYTSTKKDDTKEAGKEKRFKENGSKINEKTKPEEKKNIDNYINDKVKDTEEKIIKEIQKSNGKRFSEVREVPSDKAKEILESIKSYK